MSGVLQTDKDFLILQREDRMKSSMSGVDKTFSSKIAQKVKKQEKNNAFKEKHNTEIAESTSVVNLEQNSSSSSSSDEDAEFIATPAKIPR